MIDTVSITNLKQNTTGVLKKVKSSGNPVVVINRSEPAAVLLDLNHYRILEKALEDIEDLRAIEDRKNEKGIDFEKYLKKRFKNKNASSK